MVQPYSSLWGLVTCVYIYASSFVLERVRREPARLNENKIKYLCISVLCFPLLLPLPQHPFPVLK